MSEEKLYAIKNDEGEWTDTHCIFGPGAWATPDKTECEEGAKYHGGHVVTLIEEPKKVVLTKEQAEIVENAHFKSFPATFIYDSNEKDEELLMNAYVNGFTVAKDKKYGVWVPHVIGKMYYKDGRGSNDLDIASADCLNDKNQQFTIIEIEHYGLQDCKKVEVTNDGE
ncbi:DUF1642 domain-containing protein [Latilactobacillus curvatus]|uniref:DUF1642 domain-containing protein n=1 Tax=Latilactobacillus curvatus TaxID=28038 RepID=UPI0023DBD153|nr:DUF1642 domain-containing protein [Latilactobacillus curvatus]